jgi:hypothetical protein
LGDTFDHLLGFFESEAKNSAHFFDYFNLCCSVKRSKFNIKMSFFGNDFFFLGSILNGCSSLLLASTATAHSTHEWSKRGHEFLLLEPVGVGWGPGSNTVLFDWGPVHIEFEGINSAGPVDASFHCKGHIAHFKDVEVEKFVSD